MIMIVDDNPVDLFVGKRTMEISGYAKNVLLQSSAVEALKYLKENADQPKRLPNIIFLDLNMPLLNGFQFLQQFQALSHRVTSDCKVVILSSSSAPRDINKLKNNPAIIKILTKPLDQHKLWELQQESLKYA